MKFHEIWQRITAAMSRSIGTRALEAEVVRLNAEIARVRAENRALLNPTHGGQTRRQDAGATDVPSAAPRTLSRIKPRGRRSWHQINRMLELDSARKPAPTI